jgi:NAD+-dependent protein deacetylase SIR2
MYRKMLREEGTAKFILETITRQQISARKLCTAFRIEPPRFLEGQPDSAYYPLLGALIKRELTQRQRLPQYQSLDDAVNLLQKSTNIIVITGAGISTSLGIPDFRSKHSGFYSKLQRMGYDDPQEVFDLERFDEDPTLFYSLAGEIIPDLRKWSPTHEFIHLLQNKEKLLTNYTQNIDNLEGYAGIDTSKLVQCHGSWATATCRKCGFQVPGETIFEDVKAKKVSYCKKCENELQKPRAPPLKRKRSSNGSKSRKRRSFDDDSDDDDEYDIPQPGVMKVGRRFRPCCFYHTTDRT